MPSRDATEHRPLSEVLEARERGDVDFLVAALTDTDREVRLVAADSLRKLAAPAAVEPLMRVARHSSDEMLRVLAIKAVGAAGDRNASSGLAEIGSGDDPLDVRVAAISELVSLGDLRAVPLLEALVNSRDVIGPGTRARHARSSFRWALDHLVELRAAGAVRAIEKALPALDVRDRRAARRAVKQLRRLP